MLLNHAETAVKIQQQFGCNSEETGFFLALLDPEHPYHFLAEVLVDAYTQAAAGKGAERHAGGDTPFSEQPMQTICRSLGSTQGMTYQMMKKAAESERMEPEAKVRELLGVINYAAGAVVFTSKGVARCSK